MVTGIEIAGLALAILPLIVNQVDGYVQSCERLKLFSSRKYFLQHKRWAIQLRTEQVFFKHALETILYDEARKSEVDQFFTNPASTVGGSSWDQQALDTALRTRLQDMYEVFRLNLLAVDTDISVICKAIGIDQVAGVQVDWSQVPTLEIFFKKLRALFKQTIYKDLLINLANANATLRGLVDIAQEQNQRKNARGRTVRRGILHNARKCAASLYRNILHPNHWPCKNHLLHHVRYEIPTAKSFDEDGAFHSSHVRFMGSCNSIDLNSSNHADALLISSAYKSSTIAIHSNHNLPPQSTPNLQAGQKAPVQQKKLSFQSQSVNQIVSNRSNTTTITSSTPLLQSTRPSNSFAVEMINMCEWVNVNHSGKQAIPKPIHINDQKSQWSHRLVDNKQSIYDGETCTLREILSNCCEFQRSSTPPGTFIFNRNQRLRAAINLTLAAFLYHDNWLPATWRCDDIQYGIEAGADTILRVNESKAFLSNQVGEAQVLMPLQQARDKQPVSSLLTSKTLLSIGCVLVELSLAESLDARIRDEDKRADKDETYLAAARSALYDVQGQADQAYYDAVRACLFTHEDTVQGLEDQHFEQEVLENIVLPMITHTSTVEVSESRG